MLTDEELEIVNDRAQSIGREFDDCPEGLELLVLLLLRRLERPLALNDAERFLSVCP